MAENFIKLMTDTKKQIQESQRTPNKINTKRSVPGISQSNCKITKTKRKS